MFIWLLKETDWLRVNLMPPISKPKLKPHFEPMICWNGCRKHNNGIKSTYELPARTVRAWASTMNFRPGCNRCRAKLLRDIVKLQKSKVLPTYKSNDGYRPSTPYSNRYDEPVIEILIDGKPKGTVTGIEFKRGMIRQLIKA